jgi:multicomponent Na+:H+ antiporter subunit G
MSDAAVAVLLLVAATAVAVSAIGVAAMSNLFDKLHYLGPASIVAPVAVAAAVVIKEGLGVPGVKSLLTATVLVITSPVLGHATARAARIRQFGHWAATEHERVAR